MNFRVVLGYLLRKSDPYYEYGLERERVKPQVVRMKPWFGRTEPKSLSKFREEHTMTYANHEFDSIKSYSVIGSRAINKTLRGEVLHSSDYLMGDYFDDEVISYHIDNLDSGMRKSPTKSDVVVWRGLNAFSDKYSHHPLEKKLRDLGIVEQDSIYSSPSINHGNISGLTGLKGFTFTEPNFVSTTFNMKTAEGFTNKYITPFICQIKVPAGTNAIYMPGAHKLDDKGIKDINPIAGEVELLLDRGLKFMVKNVTLSTLVKGAPGFIVHLEIVKNTR